MIHALFTLLTVLPLLWAAASADASDAEHHEIRITDSDESVIEWLKDEDTCALKEAEFQCLNHGNVYTIRAKMYKDGTGKHVYIQAEAVKEGEEDNSEPGFVLTKRMAAQDCPAPGECSLDVQSVCPLLDVAEVLNSDLVVIQRGD